MVLISHDTENPTETLCPRTTFSAIKGLNFLFSETRVCSAILSANCLPLVLFTNKNDQITYYHIFYIPATFFFFFFWHLSVAYKNVL